MDYQELHGERRRHSRYTMALPVNVHVAGRPDPVTVEMVDIGAKGVRFRLASTVGGAEQIRQNARQNAQQDVRQNAQQDARDARRITLDQHAAFGFVIPGQHICVASGKVMRIVGGVGLSGQDDEFVLSIERANEAFHGFLGSLAY